MLNAAAEVNHKRQDAYIKWARENGTQSLEEAVTDMPLVNGKRLDELTTDEYISYHGGGDSPRPRVINLTPPPDED